MTRQDLEAMVRETTDLLNKEIIAHEHAVQAYERAKNALRQGTDRIYMQYLDSPKEMGSNEATREAFLRLHLMNEHAAVDEAKAKAAHHAALVDMSRTGFEAAKLLVLINTSPEVR